MFTPRVCKLHGFAAGIRAYSPYLHGFAAGIDTGSLLEYERTRPIYTGSLLESARVRCWNTSVLSLCWGRWGHTSDGDAARVPELEAARVEDAA